jgi:hypothetical protein
MQPSPLLTHRRLDEIALEALVAHQPAQLPTPSDSVSIEVVLDDDMDLAVTDKFVRASGSAPYERVEIEPLTTTLRMFRRSRPTTFVKTVPARAGETMSFDKVWFEQPEEALAAIEDLPVEARRSWWWLAVSLAVAAGAVAYMAVYTS